MKTCITIEEIRSVVNAARLEGKTIGFVPTMGYLHEGHLTLVREAKKRCDLVIVSIFVNPAQFAPHEDFDSYPRDLEKDTKLAVEAGADIIYAPEVKDIYPQGHRTYVEVTGLTKYLCGASRPVFFRGIATVCTKLFNIVRPDEAFFGEKDYQQVLVVSRLVEDLNMDVKIVPVPLVREPDGLAMSSRNVYLTPEERQAALVLNRSLNMAKEKVAEGERDANKLKELVYNYIKTEPRANIDYVEILSIPDLERIEVLEGKALLALAVMMGKTRLIDNTVLEV